MLLLATDSVGVRIHLSALGCRLNEAELEQWARRFHEAGDTIENDVTEADVLVMNSCAVTREAVAKSRRRVLRLKRENPRAKLVLSGCYSELSSPTALADLGVDLVVPNADKDRLVSVVRSSLADPSMPSSATLPAEAALFTRNRHRAFVKIQDGCRYRCSFCIVTVARGAERSRSIAEIVDEVRALGAQAIREVVLTGVHVGGYGSDLDCELTDLVHALLDDTDIERIRFASVEPWDLSDAFLDLFSNPRLQPHLHLPLQSGSDTVLRRMSRRCRSADFARLCRDLCARHPEFGITTDIIVGFPGETESEWQQTLDFVAEQPFSHLHIFTYSEREGTRAANLPDPVPITLRQSRSRELHELGEQLRTVQLERMIGTTQSVLWECGAPVPGTSDRWLHSGYTPNYLRVTTEAGDNLANRIDKVMISGVKGKQLLAHQDGAFL